MRMLKYSRKYNSNLEFYLPEDGGFLKVSINGTSLIKCCKGGGVRTFRQRPSRIDDPDPICIRFKWDDDLELKNKVFEKVVKRWYRSWIRC